MQKKSTLSDLASQFGASFTANSNGASFSASADGTKSYHAPYDDTGIHFRNKLDYMDVNCPGGHRINFGSTVKGIYENIAIPNNETYRMSSLGSNEYQRFFTIQKTRGKFKVRGEYIDNLKGG